MNKGYTKRELEVMQEGYTLGYNKAKKDLEFYLWIKKEIAWCKSHD